MPERGEPLAVKAKRLPARCAAWTEPTPAPGFTPLAAKEKFHLHRARLIGQTRVYAFRAPNRGEPSSFPPRKPAPRLRKMPAGTTEGRQVDYLAALIRMHTWTTIR